MGAESDKGGTEDDERRQMVSKRYKNQASIYNQVSEMRKVQTRSELDPIAKSTVNLENSPLSDMQQMRVQELKFDHHCPVSKNFSLRDPPSSPIVNCL